MNTFNSLNHFGPQLHNGHRQHYFNNVYMAQASPTPSTESCPSSTLSTPTDVVDRPEFNSSSSTTVESDSPSSSSCRVGYSHKVQHNHHHHSIQELIRHFGRKVQSWRSEGGYRRASCSEDNPSKEQDEFRERSKSLDGAIRRPISDCEATYRIYNRILKEGRFSRI